MSDLACPVCGTYVNAAVSLNAPPANRPEWDVGICYRCTSFLNIRSDLTDIREMTQDEVGELDDDMRNELIKVRRELEEHKESSKRDSTTLRAICLDCGDVKIRLKYAAAYIAKQAAPPCPKCGRALLPPPEGSETLASMIASVLSGKG